MILEICTPTIQSAINAQNAGANRIELCANLGEGGTTPSAGSILLAKKYLTIPVFVLIRERGGSFCYNDIEVETMIKDIEFCRDNGVEGVVIGALTSKKDIHEEHTKAMIAAAGQMSVTFHRAFDRANSQFDSLDILKELGVHRVLTSGGKDTAFNGMEVIKGLVKRSENQIVVMAGSGVTAKNMETIIKETNCHEIHFSAKKDVVSPHGECHWESNELLIEKAVEILKMI